MMLRPFLLLRPQHLGEMGMKMKRKTRERRINLRLRDDELRRVRLAAKRSRLALSTFARLRLLQATVGANAVLALSDYGQRPLAPSVVDSWSIART